MSQIVKKYLYEIPQPFLLYIQGLVVDKDDLTKDIGQLRNNLEESIKHLDEINEELNQDLDKLENDLKMGLEEEKMLRGQDIGILKFNLNEGNHLEAWVLKFVTKLALQSYIKNIWNPSDFNNWNFIQASLEFLG